MAPFSLFRHPEALFVAGLLLKGTALLASAALVSLALRRASAATRHLVWVGGLTMLLALPLLTRALPWQLPVVVLERATPASAPGDGSRLAEATLSAPADPVAPTTGERLELAAHPVGDLVPPALPARDARTLDVDPWTALFLLWTVGALFVLGRLALGMLAVRRVIRAGARATGPAWTHPLYEAADRLELREVPELVLSPKARMPFAAGLLEPVIVLPAASVDWTDRRRRAVLSHELAHVRRRDLVVNVVAQLACAAWWFHPLAWIAARRLRGESERACDDLVLGIGTRASEYADHLLQIVCRTANARTPAVALPMAQRQEFEGRMLAILEPAARRGQPTRRHTTLAAAVALAFAVPLSALGVRAADGPADQRELAAVTGARGDSALGTPRAADETGDSALGTPRAADETGDSALGTRPAADETGDSALGTPRAAAWPVAVAQDTTPRVILALMRALGDSVESVRKDAAYALGRREARAAVAPLADRALRDPSEDVREMAVWSLAQIGDRQAATPVGAVLLEDASADVRAIAAWALGQFDDASSVTPLGAALTRDRSADVRARAAWALGQIQPRPAPLALSAALQDSSETVRYRAAWALGQIADPATVPALVNALRTATDQDTRKAAIWAIGRMDATVAQDGLIAALEDADPEIRAAAVRALAGGSRSWPWPWPMPRVR